MPPVHFILLFCTIVFTLGGCDESPGIDPPAVQDEVRGNDSRDSSWYKYKSNEFAFELDVLFEPDNITKDFAEVEEIKSSDLNDNRLGLSWSVANPDYEVMVYVQEMPIAISFKDSQKRILEPSIHSALRTAKARTDDALSIEWLEKHDRIYGIARTLLTDSDRKVWLLGCVAYKAFYMLWITEDAGHDANEEAERILASFRVLSQPPTAIKDAAEADASAIYVGEDASDELLEQMNWALQLAENPNRGVGYEGPFNQPEMSELQTQRLRSIMAALEGPCPFPWETWVFNIRISRAAADETIAMWAKIAIAWERLGNESMAEMEKQDFATAAYFSANGFDPRKVEDDGTITIPADMVEAIHQFIQQLTATDIDQWFEIN